MGIFEEFDGFFEEARREHHLSRKRIAEMFISRARELENKQQEIMIPITIFGRRELGMLETITKYLREVHRLKYRKIAKLTGRSEGVIGVTYRKAVKKHEQWLLPEKTEYQIPMSIFRQNNLSVFENLVAYLKEKFDMRFSEIAKHLNRNYKTIWTVYSVAVRKRNKA